MKTNYKIGETYYLHGNEMVLMKIDETKRCYPLRCYTKNNVLMIFTLDGRLHINSPCRTLSTSPTEFIAPKEEMEMCKPLEYICPAKPHKINKAIQLLKSEGYTITKQY